jgi:hypothetical protein
LRTMLLASTRFDGVVAAPSGADDELPDATRRVGPSLGILRREALGPDSTPRWCAGPLEVAKGAVFVLVVAQGQDPGQLGVGHVARGGPLIACPLIAGTPVVVVVAGSAGNVTGSRDHRRCLVAARLPHPDEGYRRKGDDEHSRRDDVRAGRS